MSKNLTKKATEGPVSRRLSRILKEFTTNNLVLLLVGGALTSLVVPYINSKRLTEETRLKKAMDIVSHKSEFNSQFNSLQTALTTFYYDNRRRLAERPDEWNLADFRAEQVRFNKEMNTRYAEFDKQAWWWYGDVLQEAYVLRLTRPENFKRLGEVTDAYGRNAGDSVGAISDFWHKVVSPEYDPKVEYEAEKANKIGKAELWNETDKRLSPLFDARRDLTDRMVDAFIE